jgi:hypothetical protein
MTYVSTRQPSRCRRGRRRSGTTRRAPLGLALLAAILAACGGEAAPAAEPATAAEAAAEAAVDEPTTDEVTTDEVTAEDATSDIESSADETDHDTQDDADGAGAVGTATVDGVTYALDRTWRCEPVEVAGFTYDLELQAFGSHEGDRIQLDVYLGGVLDVDVSWAGPEGIFGGPDPDAASADWADGRVTGTAVIQDAWEGEDHVEISFDVEVPDETDACR